MRDIDVRRALLAQLRKEHQDDNSVILEELGVLEGRLRIDVAVVNGLFAGFEIKSEEDTLERLNAQQAGYCAVFDQVTIVVGPRHLAKVTARVPEWWGVSCAFEEGSDVRLGERRPAAPNADVSAQAVVQLLWRDEALMALQSITSDSIDSRLSSKPRRYLWAALVDTLSIDDLRRLVRETLKARPVRRAELSRLSGDETFQSFSRSSHCRSNLSRPRLRQWPNRPN